MVRLREIPRTAAFAWSPGSASPFIATGTRAGAVDADFSNETFLELWDLALDQPDAGAELQPAAKISIDSGFHDLAWTEWDDVSRGVIAGALENGSLDLWNADKLLSGSSDALISRASQHTGPIKTLQFNPRHSNLLATGGGKGELFISDLNNLDQPFRLGSTTARSDDIECLDWNKKVAHILVTGSSAGFVTVWDVKTKKESLTLNNLGRKAVSAVAWDPEKPTKLITSTPLESDPLISVWDLRNSNAPERILKGHESGVLSLSWCAQDPDLLLSCGKDNRTICWNPQTGQQYGEFPVVTNWTFQTRWNPHNPNLFATASFDGKISVQTIQNTNAAAQSVSQSQPVDDEDFFAKAQTQPQTSTFSLPKPPKWLERPVTAAFGFGGRVVSVGLTEPATPGCRTSKVRITPFEIDSNVSSATETFEQALKEGDLSSICESRIVAAQSQEEKADWKVIQTLISESPRKQLIDYLGFADSVDEAADTLSKLGLDSKEVNGEDGSAARGPGAKRHKRLSSIFDTNADGDNFLTDLSPSKDARTNDPFQIYTGSESEADRGITRALLLGKYENALEICLKEDRMSDAFMIAICGGQKCINKAQEAYFAKQAEGPTYLRLLSSIVGKNMWDVVHNADLANWKEAVATICTYADDAQFPDLFEALGDRLEEQFKAENNKESRKDASFCYLASSKLEKVVSIWIDRLQETVSSSIQEDADDTSFSIHVRALQGLIEKVTVFRQVAKFQDSELQKDSDWKLAPLYEKYIEYANVVATHGRLDVAERYLSLLPENFPEADVARNRIRLATRKPAPTKTVQTQPAAAARQATRSTIGFQQPQRPYSPAATQARNTYMPPAPVEASNPYAPANTGGGYAPSGYQHPQSRPVGMAPPPPPQQQQQQYGAPRGQMAVPPPPRASNQSPSVSAYTPPAHIPAWNDLPDGFAKAPTSRRGTPSVAPVINAPFPGQQGQGGPGQSPVSAQGPGGSMPVPPPPKGFTGPPRMTPPPGGPGAPPRMMSPPAVGHPHGFQAPERPPSAASSAYAPAPGSQSTMPQMNIPPPIPRGPSPYNAPPTGPPPTNRYAPNPAAQHAGPQAQPRAPLQPPPVSHAPAPPPYASQQFQQGPPQGPYAPPSQPAAAHHQPPPPAAPPVPQQGSRPGTAQSQKKAPAPAKYPSGDRSHIPDQARPIYELLSADMQRIKSRAPSSYKAQVNDTERRLNILFDHLNNEDLLKPNTVQNMADLAHAIQVKDYEVAQAIHLDILTNRTDECGNWMVGVKRLIGMSKATP
ncbi:protein transporter SEC31 [Polytolypa hystricis UAMH7299]|uniref:Protein transport protein SEC31 n=1 Tax=Polytolypa hystricis (strain UAMH7299) TaxID=1447883 RepID=A0A2B7YRL1_POLH7|nr:protein transporter SEC31 [Polytolypa hystricis UAMH7299]